jgi:hypothetical protein
MQHVIYISPVYGHFPPIPLGFIWTDFILDNCGGKRSFSIMTKIGLIDTLRYGMPENDCWYVCKHFLVLHISMSNMTQYMLSMANTFMLIIR